ncbi:MAG: hypothetical protein A3H72_01755 [Candidatus Doudnabacteria bacterium RIFCSPLOWO2_02_FULL_48_8]|nr:MAG: hypothetical protein A3H72_01755 [Candidatus Doudnabacteria bacterium RIFCSPLOWO2_02_FULL_48_8]
MGTVLERYESLIGHSAALLSSNRQAIHHLTPDEWLHLCDELSSESVLPNNLAGNLARRREMVQRRYPDAVGSSEALCA